MMWLLDIVGGRKWLAYLALVALALAVIASFYGGVYWRGYQSADRKAEIKELKKTAATATVRADQLEAQQHDNAITVAKLGEQRRSDAIQFRSLRIEARAIEEMHRGDVCPISRDFVRLWDRALVQDSAGRAVVAASGAGDVDRDDRSEVTQSDVLDNHIENAERARANYAQCSTLIEWHRRNDGKPSR